MKSTYENGFHDGYNAARTWIPAALKSPSESGYYLIIERRKSKGEYLPKFDEIYTRRARYIEPEKIWCLGKYVDSKAEADVTKEVLFWMPLPQLPDEALNFPGVKNYDDVEAQKNAHATEIVELFEELLDEKGIDIPCSDKEEQESRYDGGNVARLYGMEYFNLVGAVQNLL